jgi:hypothetical protein
MLIRRGVRNASPPNGGGARTHERASCLLEPFSRFRFQWPIRGCADVRPSCLQTEVAHDIAECLVHLWRIAVRASPFARCSGCRCAHSCRRSKRPWCDFSRYHHRQQIAAIAQSREARTDGENSRSRVRALKIGVWSHRDIVSAEKQKTPEHDHKAHVGEAAFHGLSYWNHKGVVCAYRAGSSGRSQFRRIADPAAGIGCRG